MTTSGAGRAALALLILVLLGLVVAVLATRGWGPRGRRGKRGHGGAAGNVGPTGTAAPPAALTYSPTQVILLYSSLTGYAAGTDDDVQGAWGLALDSATITANSVDFYLTGNGFASEVGTFQKYRYSFEINTGATGIDPVILPMASENVNIAQIPKMTGLVENTNPAAFSIEYDGVTGPAKMIFVTQNGQIYGFSDQVSTGPVLVASETGASYMGCTILGNNFYAANWNTAQVDMFGPSFQYLSSFGDPDPTIVDVSGYSMYNVQAINGEIFAALAYANAQAYPIYGNGNGFIDIFTPSGTFVRRFTSRGELNTPWAMFFIPAQAAPVARPEIAVGNSGSGQALLFTYPDGVLVTQGKDQFNNTLSLDNAQAIVALPFAPPAPAQYLFAASIANRSQGVFGIGIVAPALNPVEPFPGTSLPSPP